MNPAALKSNLHHVRRGGHLIVNTDEFTKRALEKVGYDVRPPQRRQPRVLRRPPGEPDLADGRGAQGLRDHQEGGRAREEHVRPGPAVAGCTRAATEGTRDFLTAKFGRKPEILAANLAAFEAGLGLRRDHRGLRRPVRGEPAPHAAGGLPQHHRQPRAVLRADRRGRALRAAAVPRVLPDHPGLRHPPRAEPAQGVRRAHPAARGRDRRHRRRPRRRLRRLPGRHHDVRARASP